MRGSLARTSRSFSVVLMAVVAVAAQENGVVSHEAGKLNELEKSLIAKVSGARPSFSILRRTPNSTTGLIYRALTGEAELHEEFSDVFIVRSGSATLVLGGDLQERRAVGPGEVAAKSIAGGERRKLKVGDVVHIPAKLPHWVFLDPGETVTYLIIKLKD